MTGDDRRVSVLACVLLVTLRISVGWHLLYEGWWKIDTQSTPQPWSAEGYLKNATGPMRSTFRSLTGDPNDFRWLDYDGVTAEWDAWRDRFVAHYPGAEDDSDSASVASQVDRMLNGVSEFAVKLDVLPADVDPKNFPKSIQFDAEKKRLKCSGELHMLKAEHDALVKLAPGDDDVSRAFRKAAEELFKRASKLSFKERLAVLLKSDPERVGVLQTAKSGERIESRMGDIERYRQQVERYEASYAKARTATQFDHLDRQYRDLLDLKRRVVGPVVALDKELRDEAEKLLTSDQLAAGPVPEPWTPIRTLNWRTMWSLAAFGVLLIIGLFTRWAALGAAGLLMLFYLAAPPWPGVPEIPGPEHNYIVNKVYLESLTCLVIAALPSGRWFGVDAIWPWLLRRKEAKSAAKS